MLRFLSSSLALVVLCLVPLSALAGGPFQKSAVQKGAVQKVPMPVVQKSPMTVVQKSYAPQVACAPSIRYVQRRPHKRICCDGTPSIQTVLQVQDPRACAPCPVMVPVCLPGCIVGVPQVSSMIGLLGRGNVCFRWRCGYRVKVVFDNHGDIIVNYFGS
ncbi:MAG: hypothetical protein ACC628_00105 [Pirellulaceae bacterium]